MKNQQRSQPVRPAHGRHHRLANALRRCAPSQRRAKAGSGRDHSRPLHRRTTARAVRANPAPIPGDDLMNQSQLFKQAGHTSDQSETISYTVTADAAYEVICEALMKGSAALRCAHYYRMPDMPLKSASARLPVIAKQFATSSAEPKATLSAIATSCVTRTSGIRI